jgi:hypothetical protein
MKATIGQLKQEIYQNPVFDKFLVLIAQS